MGRAVSAAPRSGGPAKSAVIVGGSSGIGAATARLLAGDGYAVHLIARRAEALRELTEEIGGTFTAADMTDAGESERALAGVDAPVGVAVYAAGVLGEIAPVTELPLESWERALAVNLTGAFLFARGIAPKLEPGSRVFFLSSVAANKGQPRQAAYAASKAGLSRFAESFAAEMEPRGVGVHIVSPGPVATPMLDIPETSPFQLDAEQVADAIGYLVQLPADVVLRDVDLRAVVRGPFARRRHDESGKPRAD
jgi:NAD(P)-dependent dehydrogenase (short-subunit alcohol dehydrogenase family)